MSENFQIPQKRRKMHLTLSSKGSASCVVAKGLGIKP